MYFDFYNIDPDYFGDIQTLQKGDFARFETKSHKETYKFLCGILDHYNVSVR